MSEEIGKPVASFVHRFEPLKGPISSYPSSGHLLLLQLFKASLGVVTGHH
jgi:hypothetical protein